MVEGGDDDRGLHVRFRQEKPFALDVDFTVAPGEILALVGPSGGGKSTTLRTIAGLAEASAGTIRCNGSVWFDSFRRVNLPARRRRAGFVFQSYALFPHLTALQNVMEALLDVSPDHRREAAAGYLARVHLEGLEHRRPAELSGGQQQRVAVARALARRPAVLLLDEPFSAVDRMTRFRLQRELAELRDGLWMPVILVTHDLDEAARLADRIAVMHRGAILQTGGLAEVTTRPATPSVARLLGIRNIFDATVIVERTPAGAAQISWRDIRLETRNCDAFPGDRVAWCIPADNIIVHRRDRPSRGDHENPVQGSVRSVLRLGEMTEILLDVGPPGQHPLHCSVPTHSAGRNGIKPGATVTVSLKAEAIHLMRPEPDVD